MSWLRRLGRMGAEAGPWPAAARLRGYLKRKLVGPCRTSFSQCGEDIIVDYALAELGIPRPTYLDLGANDPQVLSNTYHFYRRGCRGVCVEPDPTLAAAIASCRPEDRVIAAGIAVGAAGPLDFYVMSMGSLSTFSREKAEEIARGGRFSIERVITVPTVSVNDVVRENFARAPDFVSIDVEGLDFDVLASFDFERARPPVFCVETLTFSTDKSEKKLTGIIDLMIDRGYFVYADTYINTIFVDAAAWRAR